MCMQTSGVRPYQKWRWAGDEIVHNPIIPAARTIPGTNKSRYPIDIREYLSIAGNAVVAETLQKIVDELPPEKQLKFFARKAGAFDFRARTIVRYFAKMRYQQSKRTFDQWLFPDETLAQKGGDCEDLAFLLAALLLAAGISNQCLRVALGVLIDHSKPNEVHQWDHAWVVYLREDGAWEILEPMAQIKQGREAYRGSLKACKGKRVQVGEEVFRDMEYIPHFVFNDQHLWRVRTPDMRAAKEFVPYLKSRKFWDKYNPSFAAGVHFDIYDHALGGLLDEDDLNTVKSASFNIDINVLAYDPRDHFDFAYIDEGWQRVGKRLEDGDLVNFGKATHSIADFYAHSLYGHFAKPKANGNIPVYQPSQPLPPEVLQYDFSHLELPGCTGTTQSAEKIWDGKLISGQWWRWYTTYPSDIKSRDQSGPRRCLPDHDKLAVDEPTWKEGHGLYVDQATYQEQFRRRRQAAIEHIRQAYDQWKQK